MSQDAIEFDRKIINVIKDVISTAQFDGEQINWKSSPYKYEWTYLKYNYAKIRNLLRMNSMLFSSLRAHHHTKMYLDGSLNFLDQYTNAISDNEIPHFIHERYRWIDTYFNAYKSDEKDKNSTLVTHDMVQTLLAEREDEEHLDSDDMKYLLKVVETTVAQCLNTIKNKIESHQSVEEESDEESCTSDETNLKSFFNNLAETVPDMLSLKKQKELKQRVNLLIRAIMEEDE